MRLAFLGSTELGYNCCKIIHESGLADIVGIFTTPQDFRISYSDKPVSNVLYRDFKIFQNTYNIPVIEVTGKLIDNIDQLKTMQPDFLLAIGWYFMIPKSFRDLAPLGCAGIHSSLLPKYRGGAPLVWAIINGEEETGVSFFYFDDGVDDGDIIAQSNFLIKDSDTIRDALAKASEASLNIIKEYIPKIANGTAPRIPQDHSKASYVLQRKPEDGMIDWSWNPRQIYNFIRAQTKPYPGAYTIINKKKVVIYDADIMQGNG